MTGDDVYTHQIPRVINECAPYLLNEYSWLQDIDTSGINSDNFSLWLHDQAEKHGAFHPVRPIHFDDYRRVDPVEEINETMAGRVIVIASK